MRRILYISSNIESCALYRQMEAMRSYEMSVLSNPIHLAKSIESNHPSLVILHLRCKDGPARAIISRVNGVLAAYHIPFVIIQNEEAQPSTADGLNWGAEDIIPDRPPDRIIMRKLQMIAESIGASRQIAEAWQVHPHQILCFNEPSCTLLQSHRIALIGASPMIEKSWAEKLQPLQHLKAQFLSVSDCLALPSDSPQFDFCILFCNEEQQLCERLVALVELRILPFINPYGLCFAPLHKWHKAALSFDMGAKDIIDPHILAKELSERLNKLLLQGQRQGNLKHLMDKALKEAVIDPLTGVYNRRHAQVKIQCLIEEARRCNSDIAVMAIDIDHFKSVNEAFGHAAGDHVLSEIAKRLTRLLRPQDFIARYGGDEFLCILPNISRVQVLDFAERLRNALHDRPIALPDGKAPRLSLSIGLDCRRCGCGQEDSMRIALEMADRALFEAKRNGRDQVRLSLNPASASIWSD